MQILSLKLYIAFVILSLSPIISILELFIFDPTVSRNAVRQMRRLRRAGRLSFWFERFVSFIKEPRLAAVKTSKERVAAN